MIRGGGVSLRSTDKQINKYIIQCPSTHKQVPLSIPECILGYPNPIPIGL